jgi:hypothetical protein
VRLRTKSHDTLPNVKAHHTQAHLTRLQAEPEDFERGEEGGRGDRSFWLLFVGGVDGVVVWWWVWGVGVGCLGRGVGWWVMLGGGGVEGFDEGGGVGKSFKFGYEREEHV